MTNTTKIYIQKDFTKNLYLHYSFLLKFYLMEEYTLKNKISLEKDLFSVYIFDVLFYLIYKINKFHFFCFFSSQFLIVN